jgi:histidinol-phosphate phosphatase family protein
MISHAVILCGGAGTRMREAGYKQPKFLLPIAEKSISHFVFKNLKKYGIESVHLLLGESSEEIMGVVEFLKKEFELRITFSKETKPRGTGGALLEAIHSLPDEFILLHGDLLIDTDLSELVNVFDGTDAEFAQIVHPSTHVFDSDLVETNNQGKIIGYRTKPHKEDLVIRNLGNAGIYAFKKKVFLNENYLGEKIDLDREILPKLVSNGINGRAIRNRQFVRDVGTPERYEKTINNLESFYKSNLPKPAIFLDRDGTLNKLNGYIKSEKDVQLLDGVGQAIRSLNKSGFLVIVVTNQPVIARGEATFEALNKIHGRIEMELAKDGALIDEIYFCPHHPDSGFAGEIPELKIECICRKPNPGLIQKACKDFQIDLNLSWVIGDSWRDVQLGEKMGIRALRIGSGEAEASAYDFLTLKAAVDFILAPSITD